MLSLKEVEADLADIYINSLDSLVFQLKKKKSITMNTEFTDCIIQTKLDAYFKMPSHWNGRWSREAPDTTA